MNTTCRALLVALALLLGTAARAQYLNSAYFLDGYTYGHELNPAKDYDRKGYFNLPFLPANLYMGVRGNLSLTDVLKKNPNGSGLVTYPHPSLSNKEAMKGFSRNNKLTMDMKYQILGFGFHAFGGYNTLGINVRANAGTNVPYDLFDMPRNLKNKDYDIDKVGATASAFGEIALGHSHDVNDHVRIGAKAKILLGMARADLKANNVHLDLSGENRWTATLDAQADVAMRGFEYGEPDEDGNVDFDNADVDNYGLNGGGVAFDLGAEWDLSDKVKGLKLSAALLDLGFIRWNNVAVARNRGEAFVFEGFHNINIEADETNPNYDPDNDMDEQLDRLGDDLESLVNLRAEGVQSKSKALGATLNIGVEYALPCYDKFSFGLLSTTRIQGVYSWNEERFSFSLSPAHWFELSGSFAAGTLGASVGGVINLHPRGFNVFVGMDHVLGRLSKQGIPLKSNADICMGVNFPLGKPRQKSM